MRVLIVSNNLGIGGKERQIAELINHLTVKPGITIGICLRENRIDFEIPGVAREFIFVPAVRPGFIKVLGFHFKVLKDFHPDIIHNWESGTALSMTILKLCCFQKIKIVDGTIRFSKRFSRLGSYFWTLRFNHLIANSVIANSEAGLKAFNYKISNKKKVIYNGFNFGRFNSLVKNNLNPKTVILGMVANFTQPKDYQSFISVSIRLLMEGNNIDVFCLGDGYERKQVEDIIPIDLKNKFRFTGLVKNPEEFAVNFHVGILLNKPGHSEGMSNTVMEYMALGLPVVCTKTGGNPIMIKENVNGFLINHGDTQELYEKLKHLILNKALREKMGEASKKLAAENFDVDTMTQQYLELYKSLLS